MQNKAQLSQPRLYIINLKYISISLANEKYHLIKNV